MPRRWTSNTTQPAPTFRRHVALRCGSWTPTSTCSPACRPATRAAFVTLVNRYNGSLLRVARGYVPSDAIAEEAVQETWMGVVRGVDRFEGRSSFKTWLFRILINRARSAGGREHRTCRYPCPSRRWIRHPGSTPTGAWAEPIVAWVSDADDRLVAATWTKSSANALDELPPRQREIVLLRDVEGMASDDVCELLGVSEGKPACAPPPWPAGSAPCWSRSSG